MAYDIGPKIGIEGEAEFRKAINQINTNMKTLGTEMQVVASQFDKNDKSQEAYTAKNQVLNKQIEEQKNKLEQLSKGLEASSEKYGENDKTTQGWQQAVNKATAELNDMERELGSNVKAMDELGNEMDDATEKGGKFSGMLGGLKEGLGKIAGPIGKAAIVGIKAVGAAAIAAGAGALKMAVDVGKTADDLITLSNQTGISTQKLQEWDYAMRFIDVPMETMTKSMAKLIKGMDSASKGGKDTTEAFSRLGVSFKDDVTGELRNNQDVFNDLIDSLGKVENETERDALAMRLFGKSAQELNPLIKAGGDELARLSEEAHKVGAVLSDDTLAAAGKFDDVMQTLEASTKGLTATLGVAAIPAISEIVNSVVGIVPKITEAIKTGDWEGAGKAVSEGINGLLGKFTDALPGLATMGSTIIGGIAGALVSAIPEILPPLIEATLMLLDTIINILIENGPMLIEAGITAILMLVNGLIQALPKIIEAALSIIVGLANGLIAALPELIRMVPQIIDTIVNILIQNLPQIIDAGFQIVFALASALITNIPTILKSVFEIIDSILKALIAGIINIITFVPKLFASLVSEFGKIKWGELGINIIKGITSGVANAAKDLATGVVDAAKGALNSAKKFLGIKSPSTVMRDQVGKMIGLGMAEGIADSAKQVDAAMNGLNNKLVADGTTTMDANTSGKGTNGTVVEHTGTIRLEGVNNDNQLYAVVDIVMDELRREARA